MNYSSRYIVLCFAFVLGCHFLLFAQKDNPALSEELRIKLENTFIDANKEHVRNNQDQAITLFKNCLAIDPNNAATHYMLGKIYLKKKLLIDAEHHSLLAIKYDKKNTWYQIQYAEILKAKNDYKSAAKIYESLGQSEKDVNHFLEAVYLYLMDKNYGKALSLLDKLEKQTGVNEDISLQKEQIYLKQNKIDKAIQEVEKLIRSFPKEERYVGMLADLYMANNKPQKALEIYRTILAKNPTNGYACFALADYYKSVNDTALYFSYLKQGVASAETDVKSKLNMIVSFIADDRFPSHADKCFELASVYINSNPTEATAYMIAGDLSVQKKQDYSSAHDYYTKAVAYEPAEYAAWQQLVFCSAELKNNEMLVNDCTKAIEHFPNEVLFHVYLTIANMQLKKYENAISSAQQGLQIVPEDQKEVRVQLYANIGDASHFLKRYAASDSAFEQALKINPENTYALNNYAYFLSLRKEKLDKAAEMSKKTLDLEPENASYLDTYGWILYRRNDFENARIQIEKSLSASPDNAEVLEHLGDVWYKLNNPEKALECWKKSKQLGGDSEFLQKKIQYGKLVE